MIYYLDLNNKHKAQSPFKYGVIKHPMDNYPIKTFFLFMRTIPPKKKKDPTRLSPPGGSAKRWRAVMGQRGSKVIGYWSGLRMLKYLIWFGSFGIG